MDRNDKSRHYHIRWSGKEALDWESFPSHADAEACAKQLVRPNESYAIEEHGLGCPRCWAAVKSKSTQPPYPWQQAVLDAVYETRPERRVRKISEAQRAIAARHLDLTPSDLAEQAAIRDALRTLRELMPEPKKSEKDSGKTEVA
jgi:hypothetical protein